MGRISKFGRGLRILIAFCLGSGLIVVLLLSGIFLSLPDVSYLKTERPATTAVIEQRKREAREQNRTLEIRQKWVPLAAVPYLLKAGVILSEDPAFFQHKGVNYIVLRRAALKNFRQGKIIWGGSTITMQLARNLFLSTERSFYRKIKEILIARKLEKELTKGEILDLYLNIVEFGEGIFGVETAAQHYFKKPVNQLNLAESVRLVSIIPSPLKGSPLSDSFLRRRKTNLLLNRLRDHKLISYEEYVEANTAILQMPELRSFLEESDGQILHP